MKVCKICQQPYDPEEKSADPSVEAGIFLARELYGDAEDLCGKCLGNRGHLAMMYCREYD